MILAHLHDLLRSPPVYIRWQRILGADRLRQICLDQFLQLREGERVLDIGCGPGYILDYMPRSIMSASIPSRAILNMQENIIRIAGASSASILRRLM